MASKMIGRTGCPECGFGAAHVKESEKCVYRYCPECQSQHHARTERQRADLLAKTRPVEGAAPAPTATATEAPAPAPTATATATATATDPAPTPSEPTATTTPATAPAPKRRGLFG